MPGDFSPEALEGRLGEALRDIFGKLEELSPEDRETALKFAKLFNQASPEQQEALVKQMKEITG